MRIVKSQADRGKEPNNCSCRRDALLTRSSGDIVSQRLSFDIIHDHVSSHILRLSRFRDVKVVDVYDIGMMQGCNDLRLASKARYETRINLQIRMKKLNSDITA